MYTSSEASVRGHCDQREDTTRLVRRFDTEVCIIEMKEQLEKVLDALELILPPSAVLVLLAHGIFVNTLAELLLNEMDFLIGLYEQWTPGTGAYIARNYLNRLGRDERW